MALAVFIGSVVAALITTDLYPWGVSEGLVYEVLVKRLLVIQYPWRFLGISSFLLITAGCLYMRADEGARLALAESGTFAFDDSSNITFIPLILVLLAFIEGGFMNTSFIENAAVADTMSIIEDSNPGAGIMNGEYLRSSVDRDQLLDVLSGQPVIHGDVIVSGYKKYGTTICMSVESGSGGRVELPLLWYPGYRVIDAQSGGSPSGISISEGSNGVMELQVAEGCSGSIVIEFYGRAIWGIADFVSLATLLLVVGSQIACGLYARKS